MSSHTILRNGVRFSKSLSLPNIVIALKLDLRNLASDESGIDMEGNQLAFRRQQREIAVARMNRQDLSAGAG